MAVSFTKVNAFVENLAEKKIDLSGTLELYFTNTAHQAAWAQLSDLTPCTGHANTDSKAVTVATSAQTAGTYKLCITDKVVTASSTGCGPFQYIYLFDQASTGDLLIGYYDYGSAITLASGDTLTMNFDDANGVLTIA